MTKIIAVFVVLALAVVFVLYNAIKSKKKIRKAPADYSNEGLTASDLASVAQTILQGLGGKNNVTSVESCITRLRVKIKDYTEVDEKKIRSTGAPGIMRPDKNTVHIIIGKKVKPLHDEIKKLL